MSRFSLQLFTHKSVFVLGAVPGSTGYASLVYSMLSMSIVMLAVSAIMTAVQARQ